MGKKQYSTKFLAICAYLIVFGLVILGAYTTYETELTAFGYSSEDYQLASIIMGIIPITIILLIVIQGRKKGRKERRKPYEAKKGSKIFSKETIQDISKINQTNYAQQKRKPFSNKIKEMALVRQKYQCNICETHFHVKREIKNWDFDHIGSRGDNSLENCQAICLNCHRDKTANEKKQGER